jgi:hypothetical protein
MYTLISVLRQCLKAQKVPLWWLVPTTRQTQLLCPWHASSPQRSHSSGGILLLWVAAWGVQASQAWRLNNWERPFSWHSTSLGGCHGNVDHGKTLATTCLAVCWEILLFLHTRHWLPTFGNNYFLHSTRALGKLLAENQNIANQFNFLMKSCHAVIMERWLMMVTARWKDKTFKVNDMQYK